MSSSFVKDCSDVSAPGNSSSGKTVIIIVNNETGNVSLGQDELQNLLASHGADGSQVSVVRVGNGGVIGGDAADIVSNPSIVAATDGTAHVNFTLEGFPTIPLEGQINSSMNYAELPLDQDAFQRLESVLESEEAREILGEPLLNMVANPDQLGALDQLMDSSLFEGADHENVNDPHSGNSESGPSPKKTRSPPKRRSQRQMDKAEREEVEKILAENQKMFKEEKQQFDEKQVQEKMLLEEKQQLDEKQGSDKSKEDKHHLNEKQVLEKMKKLSTAKEEDEDEMMETESDNEDDKDSKETVETKNNKKGMAGKLRGKGGKGQGKAKGKGKSETEKEKVQEVKGRGRGKKNIEEEEPEAEKEKVQEPKGRGRGKKNIEEEPETAVGRGAGRGRGKRGQKEENVGSGKGKGRGAVKKDIKEEANVGKKAESQDAEKLASGKVKKSSKKVEEDKEKSSEENVGKDSAKSSDNVKMGDKIENQKEISGIKLQKGKKGKLQKGGKTSDENASDDSNNEIESKRNDTKIENQNDRDINTEGDKNGKLRTGARGKGKVGEVHDANVKPELKSEELTTHTEISSEDTNKKPKLRKGLRGREDSSDNNVDSKKVVSDGKLKSPEREESVASDKRTTRLKTVITTEEKNSNVDSKKSDQEDDNSDKVIHDGDKKVTIQILKKEKENKMNVNSELKDSSHGGNEACYDDQSKEEMDISGTSANEDEMVEGFNNGKTGLQIKPLKVAVQKINVEEAVEREILSQMGLEADDDIPVIHSNTQTIKEADSSTMSVEDLNAEIFGDSEEPEIEKESPVKNAISTTPKVFSKLPPPLSSSTPISTPSGQIKSPSKALLLKDVGNAKGQMIILDKKKGPSNANLVEVDLFSGADSTTKMKTLRKSNVVVVKAKSQMDSELQITSSIKDLGTELALDAKMSPEKLAIGGSQEKLAIDRNPEKLMKGKNPEKLTKDGSPEKLAKDENPEKLILGRNPIKLTKHGNVEKRTVGNNPAKFNISGSPEKLTIEGSPEKLTIGGNPEQIPIGESPEKLTGSDGKSRLIQVKSPTSIRQVVVLNSAKPLPNKETLVKVIDPIAPPREEDRLTVAQICANAKKEAAQKKKQELKKKKKKAKPISKNEVDSSESKDKDAVEVIKTKVIKVKGPNFNGKEGKDGTQKKETPKIVDLEMKLEDSAQIKKKEAQRKREEIQRKREEILRKREAIKLRKEQQLKESMQMKKEENQEQLIELENKVEKPPLPNAKPVTTVVEKPPPKTKPTNAAAEKLPPAKTKTVIVAVKNPTEVVKRSNSLESATKKETKIISQPDKEQALKRSESVEVLPIVKGETPNAKNTTKTVQKGKAKATATKNHTVPKKAGKKELEVTAPKRGKRKVAEAPPPAPPQESPVRRSGRAIKKKSFGDEMVTFDLKESVAREEEENSESEEEVQSEVEEEEEDSAEDYDDPERLWCICQKPHNNRFMICCDRCEDWFHGTCVGITKVLGQQMEDEGLEWVCPKCKKAEKALKSTGISLTQRKDSLSLSTPANTRSATVQKNIETEQKNKVEVRSSSSGRRASTSEAVKVETQVAKPVPKKVSAGKTTEAPSVPTKEEDDLDIREVPSSSSSGGALTGENKNLEVQQIPAVTPTVLKSEPRVLVFEKATGKILSGSEAPVLREVKTWLRDHPGYAVLQPGMMGASGAVVKAIKTETSVPAAGPKKVIQLSTQPAVSGISAGPQKLTVVKSADGRIIVKAAEALTKGFVNKIVSTPTVTTTPSPTTNTAAVGAISDQAGVVKVSVKDTEKKVVVKEGEKKIKDTEKKITVKDLEKKVSVKDTVKKVSEITTRFPTIVEEEAYGSDSMDDELPDLGEETEVPVRKNLETSPMKKSLETSPVKKTSENFSVKLIESPKAVELSPTKTIDNSKSTEALPTKLPESTVKVSSPIKDTKKTPLKVPGTDKSQDANNVRSNVRKTLSECLLKRSQEASSEFEDLTEDDISELAEEIEKELYLFFGKDVGFKYKSRYRSLLFNIKDAKNSGLFRKILNGAISPSNLAKMTSEELASKELAEWREREEKKELQAIEKYELDMISLGNTYIMKSHKGEIEIDKDEFIKDKEKAPETINSLPADPVMNILEDTTSNHKNHVYDANCKICTRQLDPSSIIQDLKLKGKSHDKKDFKDEKRSDSSKVKDRRESKSSSDRDRDKERYRHKSKDHDKDRDKRHKRERSKEKEKEDKGKSKDAIKDRRESEKDKDRRDSVKEKDRRDSEKEKDRRDSEKEKDRRDSEKEKDRRDSEKEKDRRDSEKEKDRRDTEKDRKDNDRERKDCDKDKSSKERRDSEKDRYSKEKHKERKDSERERHRSSSDKKERRDSKDRDKKHKHKKDRRSSKDDRERRRKDSEGKERKRKHSESRSDDRKRRDSEKSKHKEVDSVETELDFDMLEREKAVVSTSDDVVKNTVVSTSEDVVKNTRRPRRESFSHLDADAKDSVPTSTVVGSPDILDIRDDGYPLSHEDKHGGSSPGVYPCSPSYPSIPGDYRGYIPPLPGEEAPPPPPLPDSPSTPPVIDIPCTPPLPDSPGMPPLPDTAESPKTPSLPDEICLSPSSVDDFPNTPPLPDDDDDDDIPITPPLPSEMDDDDDPILLYNRDRASTPPLPYSKSNFSSRSSSSLDDKDRLTPPLGGLLTADAGSTPMAPKTGEPIIVWKGAIHMTDVAKFYASAFEVSGKARFLPEDVPKVVEVVGRISPDMVWSYIAQTKKTGSKEILVVRFQPSNEEEKVSYIALYSYLSSKKRYGVIGNCDKVVKDFYIVPLASHQPIPQVLLPLDGPGFEEHRAHMLIGVIVRAKQRRIFDHITGTFQVVGSSSSTQNQVHKSSEMPERSYTPPLPTEHDELVALSTDSDDDDSNPEERSTTPPPKTRGQSEATKKGAVHGSKHPVKISSDFEQPKKRLSLNHRIQEVADTILSKEPQSPAECSFGDGTLDQETMLAELNRQIEVHKKELSEMQKTVLNEEEEPYSPSMANNASPGEEPLKLDTSKISIPSNLQEILNNIKEKEEEIKNKEQEIKRRLSLAADPIVLNYSEMTQQTEARAASDGRAPPAAAERMPPPADVDLRRVLAGKPKGVEEHKEDTDLRILQGRNPTEQQQQQDQQQTPSNPDVFGNTDDTDLRVRDPRLARAHAAAVMEAIEKGKTIGTLTDEELLAKALEMERKEKSNKQPQANQEVGGMYPPVPPPPFMAAGPSGFMPQPGSMVPSNAMPCPPQPPGMVGMSYMNQVGQPSQPMSMYGGDQGIPGQPHNLHEPGPLGGPNSNPMGPPIHEGPSGPGPMEPSSRYGESSRYPDDWERKYGSRDWDYNYDRYRNDDHYREDDRYRESDYYRDRDRDWRHRPDRDGGFQKHQFNRKKKPFSRRGNGGDHERSSSSNQFDRSEGNHEWRRNDRDGGRNGDHKRKRKNSEGRSKKKKFSRSESGSRNWGNFDEMHREKDFDKDDDSEKSGDRNWGKFDEIHREKGFDKDDDSDNCPYEIDY